jgi:hypothetical protein
MIIKITHFIKVNKGDIQKAMKEYDFEELEDFVGDVVSGVIESAFEEYGDETLYVEKEHPIIVEEIKSINKEEK